MKAPGDCVYCGVHFCIDHCKGCGTALKNEHVPLKNRTRMRIERCWTCEEIYLEKKYPGVL
ncbi:hypothetical protein LCGC14_1579100 [marine sediment metagenome]|uniref:Uncharacterized protein n=1 Tax=marine sediment metagenome TaxID=412755 RepID=A0A0F9KYD5_9ZZZZ